MFAVSGLTSIPQLLVPLLTLSFTPNLTTVILSTVNSLSLQQIYNSLTRAVIKASKSCHIPSYALSTGSESMNASNTSYSLLPTKFSQLPNLRTFISHNLISVQCPRSGSTRSSSVVSHLHDPLLKLLIAPFVMLHCVSAINSLYLFVNLILVPVPRLPIHVFLHLPVLWDT